MEKGDGDFFGIMIAIILSVFAIILIIQPMKKPPVASLKPRKPQKTPLQISRRIKYPLHDILSSLLKRYGLTLFNSIQQCRGLLKDYAQNEYNKEITIFSELLACGIPFYIINLSGANYYSDVVHGISKKYFYNSKNADGYKDCTVMILDVLNENGLLRAAIKEDSDKPINKIKAYIKEKMPFARYYTSIFFFYIKNHYRVIVPALLFTSSSILFLVNMTKIFENINNYKKLVEYTKNQPITTNEKPEEIYAYVNTYALNVRRGPSAADLIITQLHQNNKVEILSVEGAWSLVLFNTYKGYVDSSYLSDAPVQIRAQQKTEQQNIPVPKKLNLAEKGVKEKE
jgi:hypothetical protein